MSYFTNKKILITGAAGFIGANLVKKLIDTKRDVTIVGLDNMNDYYDVSLKEYRLRLIEDSLLENPSSPFFFSGARSITRITPSTISST